jgi:hypothetical protein
MHACPCRQGGRERALDEHVRARGFASMAFFVEFENIFIPKTAKILTLRYRKIFEFVVNIQHFF